MPERREDQTVETLRGEARLYRRALVWALNEMATHGTPRGRLTVDEFVLSSTGRSLLYTFWDLEPAGDW